MLSIFNFLLLLLAATQTKHVLADISITSPAAGATFTSTSTVQIKWTDDGQSPGLSELTSLSILLCTGPNAAINCFYTGAATLALDSLSGTFSFPLTGAQALAASGTFFFQLYALTPGKGTSIHYSPRFSVSGMTGTLPATSGGDVTPPAPVVNFNDNINNKPDPASSIPASAAAGFSVPFSEQTGPTRYAPMQMQPGSKVTHKLSASRRYPTSSVSVFTTWTMQPIQVTTTTMPVTYSKSQYVNWAAVQPDPTGYYAASEALSRRVNAKVRRGIVDL